MKNKFQINDAVKTPTGEGAITALAGFADHIEYLVLQPDLTASWFHERLLTAVATNPPIQKSTNPQ